MSGATTVSLCREGWYYLFILSFIIGGAILREVNLLFVLAGLMMGPLLFSWRMAAVTLRDLHLTRKAPESVCVGDPLLVELEAKNDSPQVNSWAIVVTDRIERLSASAADSEPPTEVEIKMPFIAAGKAERAAYQGSLLRRGKYQLGPLMARTRFPLGLMEGSYQLAADETILVCPRPGRLTNSWTQLVAANLPGHERSASRQGSIEGEFYGIRDWQSGDNRRWIHWRTSARRGKLAVRQFEVQHRPDLAVILELWMPVVEEGMQLTPEYVAKLERAISFAATIATDLCHRTTGKLLLGIAGRESKVVSGSASTGLLHELNEALALAEAGTEDLLPVTFAEALPKIPSGTTTVVITTRPDAEDNRARVAAAIESVHATARLDRLIVIDGMSDDVEQLFVAE